MKIDKKIIKTNNIRAQIVNDIQDDIYKNRKIGDKLPSEAEYSKIYGVARSTIQKALRDLEQLQLIEKIQGKGSFVKYDNPHIDIINYKGFSDYAYQVGSTPITKQISKFVKNNTMYLQRLRGIRSDEKIVWLTLDETVIDLCKYTGLDRYDFEKNSLYEILREKYKSNPATAELVSKAILPNKEQQELLGVTDKTPLLQIEGKIFDDNRNNVEEVKIIYSPNASFKLNVSL